MRHQHELAIQLVDQLERFFGLRFPTRKVAEKGIERLRILDWAHVQQCRCLARPAPLTGQDAIKGNPALSILCSGCPRLLTAPIIKVPLGAAIADLERLGVANAGRQCVSLDRDRALLAQSVPVIGNRTRWQELQCKELPVHSAASREKGPALIARAQSSLAQVVT
jgi:hypothetical protein